MINILSPIRSENFSTEKEAWAYFQAYQWLSVQMKIEIKYCHIGMMDLKQCNDVIAHCLQIQ